MYCSKCGKELGNGETICKDCNAVGQKTRKLNTGEMRGRLTLVLVGVILIVVLLILCLLLKDGKESGEANDLAVTATTPFVPTTLEAATSAMTVTSATEAIAETTALETPRYLPGVLTEEQKNALQYAIEILPVIDFSNPIDSYDIYYAMIMLHLRRNETIPEGFPTLELGTGVTPVELLYDGIKAGEEAPYMCCDAAEMIRFFENVCGKTPVIPEGELYYETMRHENGKIYEWGSGWIVSVETGTNSYGASEYILSGDRLEMKTRCQWGDVADNGIGIVTTVWEYNPESFLGYTMTDYLFEKNAGEIIPAENIESEVLRIRKIYNEIQANYQSYASEKDEYGRTIYRNGTFTKVSCPKGAGGNTWAAEYYFENDTLIFAFYFQGKTENRFYFWNGTMFRWIDESKHIYDNAFENSKWEEWESEVRYFEPEIG